MRVDGEPVIFQGVELHNVAEVFEEADGGWRLQRVPEATREGLDPPAQEMVRWAGGAEIRFVVTSARPVALTLSAEALERGARVRVFFGPFDAHEYAQEVGPEPITITIDPAAEVARRVAGLSPSVVGVDLLNLGVAGACRCEPAFADHIATRQDWHLATLALSVNMLGAGFSIEAFRERAEYLVERVASADPTRPVWCISLFPFFADLGVVPDGWGAVAGPDEYRAELAAIVERVRARCDLPLLRFVPRPSLLTDVGGHTADLIHPGDLAMIEMGQRLAEHMQPTVARLVAD